MRARWQARWEKHEVGGRAREVPLPAPRRPASPGKRYNATINPLPLAFPTPLPELAMDLP